MAAGSSGPPRGGCADERAPSDLLVDEPTEEGGENWALSRGDGRPDRDAGRIDGGEERADSRRRGCAMIGTATMA